MWIIRYIATFVKAQLVIMSSISTLCGAVLWIIGVEKGILWGLLAGLLDALPFIGTGIVLVPIAGVEIFQGKLGTALLVLCLYGVCALLRGAAGTEADRAQDGNTGYCRVNKRLCGNPAVWLNGHPERPSWLRHGAADLGKTAKMLREPIRRNIVLRLKRSER